VTGQPQFVTVRELFNGQRRFRVPIYQRAYAWGQVEIETLVRDVASALDRPAYYIGSLVLHEVRDIESDQPVFDVIDGQQRLTTLFITLTHPDLRPDLLALTPTFGIADRLLTFEERKRSNVDLATLARPEVTPAAIESLRDDGIKAGAETVANLLGDEARLEKMLLEQGVRLAAAGLTKNVLSYLLDRVQIVLTELPPDTDLNHYFEVMNTRGEQLEKHEIVKAHLLGVDWPRRRRPGSLLDHLGRLPGLHPARPGEVPAIRSFGDLRRPCATGRGCVVHLPARGHRRAARPVRART
jgi:hypothetical protein